VSIKRSYSGSAATQCGVPELLNGINAFSAIKATEITAEDVCANGRRLVGFVFGNYLAGLQSGLHILTGQY
jgi:hypothetical protein